MDCIFCKIIAGQIPSRKVYEDNDILSFYDINPMAKVHVLVIPKTHVTSVNDINETNCEVVTKIFTKIPEIAKTASLSGGYRIISNCGADAAQSVQHLHFHILGGEKLTESLN